LTGVGRRMKAGTDGSVGVASKRAGAALPQMAVAPSSSLTLHGWNRVAESTRAGLATRRGPHLIHLSRTSVSRPSSLPLANATAAQPKSSLTEAQSRAPLQAQTTTRHPRRQLESGFQALQPGRRPRGFPPGTNHSESCAPSLTVVPLRGLSPTNPGRSWSVPPGYPIGVLCPQRDLFGAQLVP
jgi:hypothetical protein